jgi:signal transduction histidine kinase
MRRRKALPGPAFRRLPMGGTAVMRRDEGRERAGRVLIVDFDEDEAATLGARLEARGYQAVAAASEAEASEALAAFDPPVVVIDAKLGEASGLALLARLKRERPNLLCVMTTAEADIETAVGALREGAHDYYVKSAGLDELLAVLDRCFEEHELQGQKLAAYEALWRAKEMAENANRAKSEFLAHMSHELRTPLNAINGFSALMMQGIYGPLDERYRAYAEDIYVSGMHLLDIINDILDLSKAEAGQLKLQEGDVDIEIVVATACRLVATRLEDAGLELAVRLPPDLPRLRGDERKLRQALLNLLSNAVKFTPRAGHIEVSASWGVEAGLILRVRDTGIGIARENIARVLQPFVQLDGVWERQHEGTGLGLPLVAAMVELHGGRIAIDSDVGKGTTVSLTFPAARFLPRPEPPLRQAVGEAG